MIDGRQLVGIISQADVATTVDEERVGDVVKAISPALWWGGCGLVLARPVAWLGARLSRQTGRIARLLFAMCPTTEFSPDGPDWRRAPGVAHWFDPRRKTVMSAIEKNIA